MAAWPAGLLWPGMVEVAMLSGVAADWLGLLGLVLWLVLAAWFSAVAEPAMAPLLASAAEGLLLPHCEAICFTSVTLKVLVEPVEVAEEVLLLEACPSAIMLPVTCTCCPTILLS